MTGVKAAVGAVASAAQDRDRKVKRPRSNPGNVSLVRRFPCQVLRDPATDRELGTWSADVSPPMTKDGKG